MAFANHTLSELLGGGKRVAWRDIQAAPRQYISSKFLLSGHTFQNPTRLPERSVKAYWNHWYTLAQSGQQFTFKTAATVGSDPRKQGGTSKEDAPGESQEEVAKGTERQPQDSDGTDEDEGLDTAKDNASCVDKDMAPGLEEDSGLDSSDEKGSGSGDEKPLIPNQCHTDAEKVAFLHSLVSTDGNIYQVVISTVAQMRVSSYCITGRSPSSLPQKLSRLMGTLKLLSTQPGASPGTGKQSMLVEPSTSNLVESRPFTSGSMEILI